MAAMTSRAYDPDKTSGLLGSEAQSGLQQKAGADPANARDMVDIQGFMSEIGPDVMELTPNPVFDFDTGANFVGASAPERHDTNEPVTSTEGHSDQEPSIGAQITCSPSTGRTKDALNQNPAGDQFQTQLTQPNFVEPRLRAEDETTTCQDRMNQKESDSSMTYEHATQNHDVRF